MLTPFGKQVRKHRVDKGVRLKDLAEALDVSSAYVSAVERGKKGVSPKTANKIAKILELDAKEASELRELAEQSTKVVKINLEGRSDESIQAATAFARKFPSMQPVDFEELLKVLNKIEHKGD